VGKGDAVADRGRSFFLAVDKVDEELVAVADAVSLVQEVDQLEEDQGLGLLPPAFNRLALLGRIDDGLHFQFDRIFRHVARDIHSNSIGRNRLTMKESIRDGLRDCQQEIPPYPGVRRCR